MSSKVGERVVVVVVWERDRLEDADSFQGLGLVPKCTFTYVKVF